MNRIWSVAGKVTGSLFLVSGGTVSIGIVLAMLLSHPPGWAIAILYTLLIFFGLAPSAIGGLLLYMSSIAKRRSIQDRFFRLLQLNQGRISLVEFASAARLEPAIARRHLDQWARECFADFEVTDTGDVYYIFSTEPLKLRSATGFEAFRQALRELDRSF
ncbi:hypothetical protein [Myxacorys almedinensis]|uniref:Uncharacterized protein n=1 Tax=Myxacorys almedinensis A TaxID=2690445 RepID=A0A8J7Z2S5_9CYAN|nr:hypothetical protein [Myxacorys almedinensis]NDJ18250.1 hypothetical protein [Myxacorys almedinensis A]